MAIFYSGLANATAFSHLALIVFLILGGPLALRWRRLLWIHVAALGATIGVNLARMDCPLTVWEKGFDRLAGKSTYEGGFISHYLVEPVYSPGIDGGINLMILSAWTLPTAVAYVTFARRQARTVV